MDCKFVTTDKMQPCKRCGYRLKRDYDKPPRRNCPAANPRLGDVTARLLERGRITKERYARIVRLVTLGAKQPENSGGCGGCSKRQAWLNQWPAPKWLARLAGYKAKRT